MLLRPTDISSFIHNTRDEIASDKPSTVDRRHGYGVLSMVGEIERSSILMVVACGTYVANGQATPQEEHATSHRG